MLLSDACYAYMEAKSKRLRRTTLEGYASGLRCHVLPAWGGRELESIRRREVQEWVDSIPTPGAAEKALKCLRQVMRWAIRSYDLEIFDPTQGVELPAKPVYRRESMDAREEASVLRAAVGQPWEAVVLCAAVLGLRPSEAAGLDWSDIDWRSGWVHVQRGAHSTQGGTVEYGCKTRLSDRHLKLPRFALERLRQLRVDDVGYGNLAHVLAYYECHRIGACHGNGSTDVAHGNTGWELRRVHCVRAQPRKEQTDRLTECPDRDLGDRSVCLNLEGHRFAVPKQGYGIPEPVHGGGQIRHALLESVQLGRRDGRAAAAAVLPRLLGEAHLGGERLRGQPQLGDDGRHVHEARSLGHDGHAGVDLGGLLGDGLFCHFSLLSRR